MLSGLAGPSTAPSLLPLGPDSAGDPLGSPGQLGEPRTGRTDRNLAVDRETARRNMTAGLVAGGFAAVVFALCFIVALLYIAHG